MGASDTMPGRDLGDGWRLVTLDTYPPQLWNDGRGLLIEIDRDGDFVIDCDDERRYLAIPFSKIEALIAQHRAFPHGIAIAPDGSIRTFESEQRDKETR